MIPGSLSFSMDSNDIILELEQLKGAFLKIADDDQKRMLDQQSTTLADVKDAMCKVMIALESRGGAGKTERIASRVTAVFERMTPVIDSLTNLHPVAPIVWGSIKVLLQMTKAPMEARSAIVESFICIADNLPRICLYGELRGGPKSRAMSSAFGEIVQFLLSVAKFYGKHKAMRFVQAPAFISEIAGARDRLVEKFRAADYEKWAKLLELTAQNQKDERFQGVLRRLDSVNYEEHFKKNTTERLEYTCTWTESHPKISAWLSGSDKSEDACIWLHGVPGTGKSVIAAYLIDHAMKSASPDEVVFYFFCHREQNNTKASGSILRAFITQIMKRGVCDETLTKLANGILDKGPSWVFSAQDLLSYFIQLLNMTRSRFIIDGLDELESPDEIKLVIDVLDTLCGRLACKVLLLSRKETYIAVHLRSWTQVEIGSDGTTDDDFRLFSHRQITMLTSAIPHLAEKEGLKEDILKAADRMFLYVRLLVDNALKNKHLPPGDIDGILGRSPRGLDEMYEQYFITLLNGNGERTNQIAFRTLQFLLYSDKPIPSIVLQRLLAVRLGDIDDAATPHDVKETLSTALGILIGFRDYSHKYYSHGYKCYDYPTFVHNSLREFLVRLRKSSTPRIDLQSLHDAIQPKSTTCASLATFYAVLCSTTFRTPLREYYDSVDRRLQKLPQIGLWKNGDITEQVDYDKMKELAMQLRIVDFFIVHRNRRMTDISMVPLEWLRSWHAIEDYIGWPKWRALGLQQLLELLPQSELLQCRVPQSVEQIRQAVTESLVFLERLMGHQTVIDFFFRDFLWDLSSLPSHLSDHNQISPGLMVIVYTFLPRLIDSASAVARAIDTRNIRSPHSAIDVAYALQSLTTTISDIENVLQLIHPDLPTFNQSEKWTCLSGVHSLARILRIHLCADPGTVFNATVVQSLAKVRLSQERKSLEQLIGLVSLALENFRYVEFALYNLDNSAAFGTNNFMYELRGTTLTLARWIVLRIALNTNVPKSERHRLFGLSDKDDFLHSKLIRTYIRPSVSCHHNDINLLDAELWRRFPFYLTFAWLLSFILGATQWLPLWLVIASVSPCIEKHIYSFQRNDPNVTYRAINCSLRFYIAGLLIAMCRHCAALFMIGAAGGVGIALHISNMVRFRFRFTLDEGVHVGTEAVAWRLRKILKLVAGKLVMLDWTVWRDGKYGVASALGNISVSTSFNCIVVYLSMHRIVTFALDPTGLERARIVLNEIPRRLEEHQPRMLGLQGELRSVCWKNAGARQDH